MRISQALLSTCLLYGAWNMQIVYLHASLPAYAQYTHNIDTGFPARTLAGSPWYIYNTASHSYTTSPAFYLHRHERPARPLHDSVTYNTTSSMSSDILSSIVGTTASWSTYIGYSLFIGGASTLISQGCNALIGGTLSQNVSPEARDVYLTTVEGITNSVMWYIENTAHKIGIRQQPSYEIMALGSKWTQQAVTSLRNTLSQLSHKKRVKDKKSAYSTKS